MSHIIINLLIIFSIIFIVERSMSLFKVKNTKFTTVLSFLLMALLAFVINPYIPNDYKNITQVLSIAFLAVAFVSFFKKNENK